MTLCIVNTFRYLRGGDSAYALALEQGLRDRGLDVANFAMEHPETVDSPEREYFAEQLDFPRLKAEGGLRNAVEVMRRSIYNQDARASLSRLLDARSCQAAHLHSVMHHLTASVVMELYERSIPVIWTLHDLKSVCPTTLFLREGQICEACSGGHFYNATRYRCKRGSIGASAIVTAELYLHRFWKVYERADLLLAPSRFLRDKVLESGLRPRRIEVLPNPVDTASRRPAVGDGQYVLYVGRVSREKGVGTLVEACANAGVQLRIVGTGEELEAVQARAAAIGPGQVHFEGYCSGQRLHELYQGARLVALPSECYENCPMVALEAFAFGKPVLGSALGGLVEMLEDRGVGDLVVPGSVPAWTDAISRWMSDPGQCAAAGARARHLAEGEYSPARHFDRLLEFYEAIAPGLAGRSAPMR